MDDWTKVSSSFATVRTAFTTQSGQIMKLMRQAAVSLANVDEMPVGLERSIRKTKTFQEQKAAINVLLQTVDSERRGTKSAVNGECAAPAP